MAAVTLTVSGTSLILGSGSSSEHPPFSKISVRVPLTVPPMPHKAVCLDDPFTILVSSLFVV